MSGDMMKASGKRQLVSLASLNIDYSYQRQRKSTSRLIARNFMPQACKDLFLGRRADDSLWIIDGQQEYFALTAMGYPKWYARIVPSTGSAYEAELFVISNGGRGSVSQLTTREMFQGLLTANDELAHRTMEAVASSGLKLALSGGCHWPNLTCVGAIYRLAQAHGCEPITRGCRLIVDTWPNSNEALRDLIPRAVIKIVAVLPDIKDDRFVSQLGKKSAKEIVQAGRIPGDRATAAFENIMRQYNKGLPRKARLPICLAEVG